MPEAVKVCLKCGRKKVNGVWYLDRNIPAHTPVYTHDICPECKEKGKCSHGNK